MASDILSSSVVSALSTPFSAFIVIGLVESSADNSSEAQTSNVSAEGGNPGNTDSFALEITISEDKYFVNNHEIGIEELKSEIDGLEAGATIKINDEKSSLKAFNAVKDYLDEKKIAYSVSNR